MNMDLITQLIYNQNKIDLLLLGDSYVEGY